MFKYLYNVYSYIPILKWLLVLSCLLGSQALAQPENNKPDNNVFPLQDQAADSQGALFNMWPVFYSEDGPQPGFKTREFLWPFIFCQKDVKETAWGFRPLFTARKTDAGPDSEKRHMVLWPIFEHRTGPGVNQYYLLPLYYYNKQDNKDHVPPKKLFIFFPVVLGGTKEGEDYLAVFPAGGRLKGWLGTEEIKFVLWPCYTTAVKGQQKSLVLFWPVYSRTRSPEIDSWRFWPLMGHGRKKGEYEKSFFLWPVFNFQRLELSEEKPGRAVMIFPLYANIKKKDFHATSVLWPFFGVSHNKRLELKQRHLPWPLVTKTDGKNIRVRRFWPLAGSQKKDNTSSAFFLWPIFFFKDYQDLKRTEQQRMMVPFYFSNHQALKEKQEAKHSVKLWPLCYYERNEPGGSRFYMISPLWFEKNRNLEINYAPFWRVWNYERNRQGHVQANLIGRLFSYERDDNQKSINLIHLINYTKGQQDKKISLLKGFLEYKNASGRRTLRMLYVLKIKISGE